MTEPQPRNWGKLLLRYAVLITVAMVVGLLLTVGLENWRDWTMRRNQIAAMRETEARSETPPSAENFAPIEVVSRPPLVTGFEILDRAEADEEVSDDEMVLALSINGQARAYPLNVMTGPDREVFNDTLGGTAIAATW